jgi:hypothetical protein
MKVDAGVMAVRTAQLVTEFGPFEGFTTDEA